MEQGAEMTTGSIPMDCILDRLTAEDDPAAWTAILSVVSEEFAGRYLAERGRKESWFLRIGACSHWWRPHQSRWTAAGGFAWPVGYKGASGWSNGLPEFDWSVILALTANIGNESANSSVISNLCCVLPFPRAR